MGEISKIRNAFQEAASVLGISFRLPPIESLESISPYLIGHLAHFGNVKGCIPLVLDAPSTAVAAVGAAGFYSSQLSSSYAQLDVAFFRDTLND